MAKLALPPHAAAKPAVALAVELRLSPAVPPRVMERTIEKRPEVAPRSDGLSLRCRILLNEAQREIDRLRRSVAAPEQPRIAPDTEKCPCESPADPPVHRRTYAVDPIGKPPPPREDAADIVLPARVILRPHVTNVGSLLDVLV